MLKALFFLPLAGPTYIAPHCLELHVGKRVWSMSGAKTDHVCLQDNTLQMVLQNQGVLKPGEGAFQLAGVDGVDGADASMWLRKKKRKE